MEKNHEGMEEPKPVWDQAWYYQCLLQVASQVPKNEFAQIERLAVLLLVQLLLRNAGSIDWSLQQIEDEIGVSRVALNNTLKKLCDTENSFAAFLRVGKRGEGPHYPYQITLVDWQKEGRLRYSDERYQLLPVPHSLASQLPTLFENLADEVIWEEQKTIDDLIFTVKVKRKRGQDIAPIPRIVAPLSKLLPLPQEKCF